ncbi:hypothetical protein FEZ48_11895 [Marinilactibacillus psychrotolerans]|uniref:Uncharacterized protein n=1 Tax=Marinilactibacillus psychrotolerans TaxID=191770 RepID=A0A5R9BZU2_9LACT|nr:hypothetical protein [Marinilactibacillus psychrotolerans]TLQ05832.1 hypothetical protein FEZ48_11895 [Marinilactibacillus psychrotolerans]
MSVKYIITLDEYIFEKYYYGLDGNFQEINGELRNELDRAKTFETFESAINYCKSNTFKFNNQEIDAYPEISDLMEKYNIEVRAVLVDAPKNIYFDKEDVKKVIASGDDTYNSVIVVTHDGKLLLYKWINPLEVQKYAASSGEVSAAGNGYVGFEAASDKDYVEETYKRLMQAWRSSLLNEGKFIRGLDYNDPSIDVEEIKNNIENTLKEKY